MYGPCVIYCQFDDIVCEKARELQDIFMLLDRPLHGPLLSRLFRSQLKLNVLDMLSLSTEAYILFW